MKVLRIIEINASEIVEAFEDSRDVKEAVFVHYGGGIGGGVDEIRVINDSTKPIIKAPVNDNLTAVCRNLLVNQIAKGEHFTIPCIKLIREKTGSGLREAKDAFDEWKKMNFTGNITIINTFNRKD